MKNYISYNIKDVIKDFLKRACGENKGFLFFVLSRDIMIVLCVCEMNYSEYMVVLRDYCVWINVIFFIIKLNALKDNNLGCYGWVR